MKVFQLFENQDDLEECRFLLKLVVNALKKLGHECVFFGGDKLIKPYLRVSNGKHILTIHVNSLEKGKSRFIIRRFGINSRSKILPDEFANTPKQLSGIIDDYL